MVWIMLQNFRVRKYYFRLLWLEKAKLKWEKNVKYLERIVWNLIQLSKFMVGLVKVWPVSWSDFSLNKWEITTQYLNIRRPEQRVRKLQENVFQPTFSFLNFVFELTHWGRISILKTSFVKGHNKTLHT